MIQRTEQYRSIKDIKAEMLRILKIDPLRGASLLAKDLNVPKQTVFWLAEDMNHNFYNSFK